MASPQNLTVPVTLDAEVIVRQLATLRSLCSQIGFALDTAILALCKHEPDEDGCCVRCNVLVAAPFDGSRAWGEDGA